MKQFLTVEMDEAKLSSFDIKEDSDNDTVIIENGNEILLKNFEFSPEEEDTYVDILSVEEDEIGQMHAFYDYLKCKDEKECEKKIKAMLSKLEGIDLNKHLITAKYTLNYMLFEALMTVYTNTHIQIERELEQVLDEVMRTKDIFKLLRFRGQFESCDSKKFFIEMFKVIDFWRGIYPNLLLD